MRCRGCCQERELLKAHVVPESFFRDMQEADGQLQEHSIKHGIYPRRRPIGLYDTGILCLECEKNFQDPDEYGQQTLIQRANEFQSYFENGVDKGYSLCDVDGDMLKRFIVSVLWRASVSKLDFFNEVELGPFEESAKAIAWGDSVGADDKFPFFIAKYRPHAAARAMVNPVKFRMEGLNFVKLCFCDYLVFIQVDSRSCSKYLKPLQLNGRGILLISGRDLAVSPEYSELRRVALLSAS